MILRKDAVYSMVSEALRTGKLIKPNACEYCDVVTDDLEAHHYKGYEYDSVYKVHFICGDCHRHAHGRTEEKNKYVSIRLSVEDSKKIDMLCSELFKRTGGFYKTNKQRLLSYIIDTTDIEELERRILKKINQQ